MIDPLESFDETLRVRYQTVTAYATTLVHSPRSTVEPPQPASNTGSRAALEAFQALAETLGADGTRRLSMEATLGQGGMGIVRSATQLVLGRKVAVKMLRDDVRGTARALDLLREAWTTGGLEHPNIVPVYDVGVDDRGGPMVVLKRIEGAHWGEVVHDPSAIAERFGSHDPLEWNLRILVSVCNALAFAHSRGIVHRDVKPENVMVGRFGEVYLLDWGIAVTTNDDDPRLPKASDAHDMAGTPCYMAPEMLGGQPERIGPRTDVYLLGAILFEILTGRPPHDGAEMREIIASVLVSEPALPDSVPLEAARLCRAAMARDPDDRLVDAEAFRGALEAFLHHRGSLTLSHRADESRALLAAALAAQAKEDELYDRLGECRFGYRAALAAWEGNDEARQGLDAAITRMIDYALAHDDPHGAARLLRELGARPNALVARVEEAGRAKDAEQRRLLTMQSQLDPKPGSRTRVFIALVMGVLWVFVPTLAQLHGVPPTYPQMLCFLAVMSVTLLVLRIWARDSLTKTLVNRRITATIAFMLALQTVLELGGALTHMPARTTMLLFPVAWTAIAGTFAIWFERRFWPTAVVGLVAIPSAMHWPTYISGVAAFFNLTLVLNAVFAWTSPEDVTAAEKHLRKHIDEHHPTLRRYR